MNRCDSCKTLSTCPLCGASATSFRHVGVRGTTSQLRIPVIDYDLTYDRQPSGIWHYSQPCNHRVRPVAVSSIVKYNGGPLWQDGYTWQDVYWGTYYTKPSSAQWISRLELAVAHMESDPSYSAGLRQYNVGIGKVIRPVTIQQDPSSPFSYRPEQPRPYQATSHVEHSATITTQSMDPTDPSTRSSRIRALEDATSARETRSIL